METIKKDRQECRIFSRVNGWYGGIDSFNKGKVEEYKDRKEYKVNYGKLK